MQSRVVINKLITIYLMHRQCVDKTNPLKIALLGLSPGQRLNFIEGKQTLSLKCMSVNPSPASKAEHSRKNLLNYVIFFWVRPVSNETKVVTSQELAKSHNYCIQI